MDSTTQAPPFDYITAHHYRAILEADFAEMQICLQAGAWKAAMVMAGSLIEAILIEHLEWLSSPGDEERLRKIMLAEAITRCEAAGEISETAAKLCSAVKDYRNLIHPGKVVRDSVAAPDQNNALIVTALVGKITHEVAAKRNARSGFTAEQILRKIERDTGAIAVVPHMLRQIRTQEKARLLLDVLPAAYAKHSAYEEFDFDESLLSRISTAYRLVLNESPEHAEEAARMFYTLLLSGDSTEIYRHSKAFFRAPDAKHLESQERAAVVDYLIDSVLPLQDEDDEFAQTIGIGPFLTVDNFAQFLTPLLRHVLSSRPSKAARNHLSVDLVALAEDVQPEAKKHLLRLANLQEKRGNASHAADLREFAEWVDFPF
ncbi:hypothetical protein I5T88_18705 [Stenotrophomonas maltophilia]|nr:hypothetical protein [Stenotrophomonas maltophilia]